MPRVIAAEREMGRLDSDGVRQPHSLFAVFSDIGNSVGKGAGDVLVIAGPSPATLTECHAIIRNALIGGAGGSVDGAPVAVTDTVAADLVRTYCYPARPAMHDLALAWEVLSAAIYGIDSGSKKKGGGDDEPKPS